MVAQRFAIQRLPGIDSFRILLRFLQQVFQVALNEFQQPLPMINSRGSVESICKA